MLSLCMCVSIFLTGCSCFPPFIQTQIYLGLQVIMKLYFHWVVWLWWGWYWIVWNRKSDLAFISTARYEGHRALAVSALRNIVTSNPHDRVFCQDHQAYVCERKCLFFLSFLLHDLGHRCQTPVLEGHCPACPGHFPASAQMIDSNQLITTTLSSRSAQVCKWPIHCHKGLLIRIRCAEAGKHVWHAGQWPSRNVVWHPWSRVPKGS